MARKRRNYKRDRIGRFAETAGAPASRGKKSAKGAAGGAANGRGSVAYMQYDRKAKAYVQVSAKTYEARNAEISREAKYALTGAAIGAGVGLLAGPGGVAIGGTLGGAIGQGTALLKNKAMSGERKRR